MRCMCVAYLLLPSIMLPVCACKTDLGACGSTLQTNVKRFFNTLTSQRNLLHRMIRHLLTLSSRLLGRERAR